MPLYDYDCANCGKRFEILRGVHVDDPTSCPLCGGGPVKKAFAAPAIHFKGSGWAKKERRATSAAGSSRSTSEDGSADKAAAASSSDDSSAASNGGGDSASSPSDSSTATGPKETSTDSNKGSDRPAKSTKTKD